MAVSNGMGIGRALRRNAPEVTGGVVGVGAPVALREFADVRDGQAVSLIGEPGTTVGDLTRPSVAWGLGAGGLTGVLWLMDIGGPPFRDFYLAHALTGIPTGVAFLLLPREASGGGNGGGESLSQRAVQESRPSSNGEFSPTDGESQETQPAE